MIYLQPVVGKVGTAATGGAGAGSVGIGIELLLTLLPHLRRKGEAEVRARADNTMNKLLGCILTVLNLSRKMYV